MGCHCRVGQATELPCRLQSKVLAVWTLLGDTEPNVQAKTCITMAQGRARAGVDRPLFGVRLRPTALAVLAGDLPQEGVRGPHHLRCE